MKVRDVMLTGLPTARETDTVQSIVVKVIYHDIGVVPILGNTHNLIGIIALRDIMMPMYPGYGDYIHDNVRSRDFEQMEEGYARVLTMKAGEIMTSNPMTVSPDDPVLKAASYMGLKNLRRIPVVEGNQFLGIVGINEINKALFFNLL
ncbi:MAG: HPP family protein [Nitrospiria bacterium]